MAEIKYKRCPRCELLFVRGKHGAYCKPCDAKRAKEYRTSNREEYLRKRKIWSAKHRAENKESIREYRIAWYKKNPGKHLEYNKKKDREKIRENVRRWNHKHQAKAYAITRAYQAKKLKAFPRWANKEKIYEMFLAAKAASSKTGIVHHVDHIVPLRHPLVCGLHNEFNLQVLTAVENMKKGNRSWPDMP